MQEKHMTVCPVCETTNWTKIYTIDRWDIDRCPDCGFAKIDPLPQRDSRPELYTKEEVIKRNTKKKSAIVRFSRKMKQFANKTTKRNKSSIFYDKLSGYLSPGKKILDVGCGDGSFLNIAKDRFQCSGVEISGYLADLANKKGGMDVKVGDFQSMNFNGEKFDGITMISIIEHLDDPYGTLQKCFDSLNDQGVLLLKTVNYSCLNRVIVQDKWTGLRPPDHVIYFSPSNLAKMLKKIGFRKIKMSAWAFNDNMYCDAVK